MGRFARTEEKSSIARSLLLTFVFLSTVPFNIILRAFTLKVLWGWFVQPLGLPVLGYAHATGLVTTVALFMLTWALPKLREHEESSKEIGEEIKTDEGALALLVRSLFTSVTLNACFLLFGYIYHRFM